MSETEHHKGHLIPLVLSGVTEEERAESVCKRFGFEKQDHHKSYVDCVQDEGYRKIYFRDSVFYEIKDEELNPDSFSSAEPNVDGGINYHILYHNGGASFDEVLDSAINKMDKE